MWQGMLLVEIYEDLNSEANLPSCILKVNTKGI